MKSFDFMNEIDKNELNKLFDKLSKTMQKEILDNKQKTKEVLEECKNDEELNEFKIYNLDIVEKIYYIKNYTNGLNNIDLKEVKQIETDFYNNIYVILDNGNLYINGVLNKNKVDKIHIIDGFHLYQITTENQIIPCSEEDSWSNLDFYLCNNYNSYKKVVTTPLYIAGLTTEGQVISAHCNPCGIGVEPENFCNIDNILTVDEEVYVVKNGVTKPLYIC